MRHEQTEPLCFAVMPSRTIQQRRYCLFRFVLRVTYFPDSTSPNNALKNKCQEQHSRYRRKSQFETREAGLRCCVGRICSTHSKKLTPQTKPLLFRRFAAGVARLRMSQLRKACLPSLRRSKFARQRDV